MSQDVTNDLEQGVLAGWALSPALVAAVPVAKVYAGGLPAEPVPPYASLKVEPIRREIQSVFEPGSTYADVLRLTVSVWAAGTTPETTAGQLALLVMGGIGHEGWSVPDRRLMAVLPDAEPHAEEDGTYQGDPVWRADVGFEVWVQGELPFPGYDITDSLDLYWEQIETPWQITG